MCSAGYYLDRDGTCQDCLAGASCATKGSELSSLQINEGYFRFHETSTKVYECFNSANCMGGGVIDLQCKAGTEGPLCAVCESDWYSDIHGACYPCEDFGGSVAATVTSLPLLILASLLMILLGMRVILASCYPDDFKKKKAAFFDWKTRNQDALAKFGSHVTVVIVTMQTMIIVAQNHEDAGGSGLPSVYAKYLWWWEFAALDIFVAVPGAGCVVGGFASKLIGQTALFAFVWAVCVGLWAKKKRKGDPKAYTPLRMLVVIIKLVIPAVTRTISETFRCADYDRGDAGTGSYLLVDHNISCTGPFYQRFLVPFSACMVVLIPIGIPLLFIVQLNRLKPILLAESTPENEAFLETSPFRPLFRNYKPAFSYWYDLIDLGRRFLFTCGTLLFRKVSGFFLLALSTAVTSIIVHNEIQPFTDFSQNQLVSIEHWQSLQVLLFLLLQDAEMFESTQYEIVGGVLVLLNVLMIAIMIRPAVPIVKAQLRSLKQSFNVEVREVSVELEPIDSDGGLTHGDVEVEEVTRTTFDNPMFDPSIAWASEGSHEAEVEAEAEAEAFDVETIYGARASDDFSVEIDPAVAVELTERTTSTRASRNGGARS